MRSDTNLEKSTRRAMSRLFGLAAIAISLLVAAAGPTYGQANCGTRDDLLRILRVSYAEVPIAKGVTEDGKLVELLTNETGWSWSILVTTPAGKSCLIADGEGWEIFPAYMPGGLSS